jgi:hypothetical protein
MKSIRTQKNRFQVRVIVKQKRDVGAQSYEGMRETLYKYIRDANIANSIQYLRQCPAAKAVFPHNP